MLFKYANFSAFALLSQWTYSKLNSAQVESTTLKGKLVSFGISSLKKQNNQNQQNEQTKEKTKQTFSFISKLDAAYREWNAVKDPSASTSLAKPRSCIIGLLLKINIWHCDSD